MAQTAQMAQPQGAVPTEQHVNGDSIQFEYSNDDHQVDASGKKKKKKKKSKAKKQPLLHPSSSVTVTGVEFENPDMDYPESRVLKQDSNGDVIVQSIETPLQHSPGASTTTTVKKQVATKSTTQHSNATANGNVPLDYPPEMNDELKSYWEGLSLQEKKDLLNLERDSVFKVMREQQKITCNCTVCGRKRAIIEDELTKLYDSYYVRIENDESFTDELFHSFFSDPSKLANVVSSHNPQQQYQNQHQHDHQHPHPHSHPHSHPHPHPQQQPQQQPQPQQQSRKVKQPTPPPQAPLPPSNAVAPQMQAPPPQQQPDYGTDSARRNGIMSVAEDLLQNDGKKFLEMMEKLAESRLKRQSELLKRTDLMVKNTNQIEEEENSDYNHDGDDDEHLHCDHDHNHYHQQQTIRQNRRAELGRALDDYSETYKIPPQPEVQLPEDPVSHYFTGEGYDESKDEDYVPDDDEDSYGEYTEDDTTDDDEWYDATPADLHEELVEVLRDQSDYFAKETALLRASNNEYDRRELQRYLERQQQLQNQLQRERQELRNLQGQLQETYIDDEVNSSGVVDNEVDDLQEDLDDFEEDEDADEDEDDDGEEEDDDEFEGEEEEEDEEEEEEIDEDDEEEEFSDDAIDEESQLQEGRTMLQLCTTKMLRQSLLKSYKEKKIQEQALLLLAEEDEARDREKRKEEKKQRDKEKKREKKRAIQQQKEEERLKKQAEEERIAKEKREEMIRKTEEGRKRKEEADRKRKEEIRRKEEEEERRRKEKEEKKRIKEEAKRKEEEEKQRVIEQARLKKEEEARVKREKEEAIARKKREEQEAKLLQEKLKKEEEELQRQQIEYAKQLEYQQQVEQKRLEQQQAQERSNSNVSIPAQNAIDPLQAMSNPLLESLYSQNGFMGASSSLQNPSAAPSVFAPMGQQQAQQPAGSSFFTPRLSDPMAAPPAMSPWGQSVPLNSSVGSASVKPLEQTFGSGLFDQPSQTPGVDDIINSLGSTNLDNFNSAGGLFPGRNLWSNDTPSNGWSTSATQQTQRVAPTAVSSSTFNAFGSSGLGTESSLGLNGGLWGSSSMSTQAPPPSTFTPTSQIPNSSSTVSSGGAEDLLRNYQSQIFKAYHYLSDNNTRDRMFVTVDSLYRAFASLFEHESVPAMNLFIPILQSPSDLYESEFLRDELGQITHVKCLPSVSQMPTPPPPHQPPQSAAAHQNPFGSRSNSGVFGGFVDVNGGMVPPPPGTANGGANIGGGLFGMSNGLSSSTWGSTF